MCRNGERFEGKRARRLCQERVLSTIPSNDAERLRQPMPEHNPKNKQNYLDDELLLIQNSGEIPEVTYHGSLFFLTEDAEGPFLSLSEEDLLPLKEAVFERYRRIIFRDVNPALRHKRIYRGLQRCIANWERFGKFCRQERFDADQTRLELREALRKFLLRELDDLRQGRPSSINCSAEALCAFMEILDLGDDALPRNWRHLLFPSPQL